MDLLPWTIDINPIMTPISSEGWSGISVDSSSLYCGYRFNSSGRDNTVNAEACFDVVLARGSWIVELLTFKSPDTGTYTILIDNAPVHTFDGYAPAISRNIIITTPTFTIDATGKKRLKVRMTGKHASSSGYGGVLQSIRLRRTA